METLAQESLQEAIWIAGSKSGDAASFNHLVLKWERPIYNLALRMLQDAEEAAEASQEVFLRAFKSIRGFRADSAFSTWLYRVAVNRVTDALRSEMQRTKREVSDEMVQVPEPAARGASPLAALELEAAIAALPTGARVTFVLHDVEGYTHEEIATMTGIAVGTSKAQLHRARRLLQQKLER